jgi:rfaE bifunctional protein nucleotidyltransferase chain/domain|tara:strand:- start:1283 stop:1717 length:435 start_codon:yes stop_codon:yes gene_type:complete
MKTVATNGCFDILHVGHVQYLNEAKSLGDKLIVGLNSDRSVKKLKGESRPYNNEQNRAAVLSALRCVDEVVIFDDISCEKFLMKAKPDIYVKGGDYSLDDIPDCEKRTISELQQLGYCKEVKILKKYKSLSTTDIIRKLEDLGP